MGRKNVIVLIISLSCLLSCGLEDFYYIDYIDDFTRTVNTSAYVRLPSSSDEGYSSYFTHFEIYYRIYISGEPFPGLIDSTNRSQINNTLDSDFRGLNYLTDKSSTSANPSNLDTVFSNRRYFKLTLAEANIDNVLNRTSSFSPLGKILEIRFPGNAMPELRLIDTLGNSVSYTVHRANSGPGLVFSPRPPDRYFINTDALNASANATNLINADVVDANSGTPSTPRYTYVSMYIFAIGKDYITTIYSQPTHINIFRLAEEF
jgi:hypothetical protein